MAPRNDRRGFPGPMPELQPGTIADVEMLHLQAAAPVDDPPVGEHPIDVDHQEVDGRDPPSQGDWTRTTPFGWIGHAPPRPASQKTQTETRFRYPVGPPSGGTL